MDDSTRLEIALETVPDDGGYRVIDWAWWFALLGGFVLGFVVAAITTAKMRRVSRMFDRPLDGIETWRQRFVPLPLPLPRERQGHPN